jgi:transcriptional regulator with XRE-family HTH domain
MDKDQLLKKFGENLKSIRKAKGREWTHRKLGDLTLTDPQHISKLERGKHEPGIITVILLAKALDCQPGDLLNNL